MENDRIALTTGKKSIKELAAWFGVRPQSFSNKKGDFLKKLENYADYKITDTGKVEIITVKEPYYVNERAIDIIQEFIPLCWNSNNYDTCSNVGEKISVRVQENSPNSPAAKLKKGTVANYTRRGRMVLFGSPDPNNEKHYGGTLGYCQYAWCKEPTRGNFIPLTEEEDAIRREIFYKLFGSKEEIVNKYEYILSMMASIESGDCDSNKVAEEAVQVASGLSKEELSQMWPIYKATVAAAIGCNVTQCTLITRYATPQEMEERKKKNLEIGF